MSTVSVVTITQYKRRSALRLLYECIKRQTRKPDEWVIVEGSPLKEDADSNAEQIHSLRDSSEIRIVYIPFEPDTKLGGLRNRGNKACMGDITVCMDDDDYYPSTRIEHVLSQMERFPDVLIAGCSNMLLYDFGTHTFYQCTGYHKNHSTNNAMAWRKKYLENHEHDMTRSYGEESSFTNNFTEPMIQLLPTHTVITSSHTSNTFDKRELIKNNPKFRLLPTSSLFTMMTAPQFHDYEFLYRVSR